MINVGHKGSQGNAFVLSPDSPTPADGFDSSFGITQNCVFLHIF